MNPTEEKDQNRKSGDEHFVGTVFYCDQNGGDHERKRDIEFSWQEVEQPGTIDIEIEPGVFNSFDEYHAGAPDDLFEEVIDEIHRWMDKSMPGYTLRKVSVKQEVTYSNYFKD